MTFLSPYWLFAASAILIPIAIHLWNKRQGKTVKIGSLRWLEPSASKRWSSIKLTGVWLLALRCLILILLAMALAQPVLVHQPQKAEGKKGVFISQELLYTSALNPIRPAIDSLLQRGYTLHAYAPGLRQIQEEEWQQISNRATDSTLSLNLNYWSILPAVAEEYKNPQDSVWLFTSDQKRFFAGSRPETIPENIRWIPVTTNATASWLHMAVETSPDSLMLTSGHSSPEGITFSRHRASAAAQRINLRGNQVLQLQRQNDSIRATIGSTTSMIQVQTEPLRVTILSGEKQEQEAHSLKAAIKVISNYTGLPIDINADTSAADWIFWLRAAEVPESIKQRVKNGLNLWVQPENGPTTTKTNIAGIGGTTIKIHQLSPAEQQDGEETGVWIAANSKPVLSVQPLGKGKVYTFRSGFTPAWSELGSSAQLPELLLPVLLSAPEATTFDLRALDEQQLIPPKGAVVAGTSVPEEQREPLLPWVVLAAFVLFLIERVIVNRRSKVQI